MNSSRNIDVQDSFINTTLRFRRALLLIIFILPLHATDHAVKWENLTSEDGLSQNSVYTILQDSDGFMWFGTRLGLNRYDGNEFKVFNYNPLDENSLPGYHVIALCEDKDGDLWVGTTSGGIGKYISSQETFENFKHDPDNPNSLPSNNIRTLFADSRGMLWIGTDLGLSRYDAVTRKFTNFYHDPAELGTLPQNRIFAINEQPAGTLWIGTENGAMMKMSLDDLSMKKVLPARPESSISIRQILTDQSDNSLIVARFGSGLYFYDISSDGFTREDPPTDQIAYGLAGPVSLARDLDGFIWVGTPYGVVTINMQTGKYRQFTNNEDDPASISSDVIYSTYVDRQGIIWVGTETGGVNFYDPSLIRFQQYGHDDSDPNSLPSDGVFSVSKDFQGNIWFGTIPNGVSVMDEKTGKHRHISPLIERTYWSADYISRVRADTSHTIFFGTFECGIFTLDYPTGTSKHYRNREKVPHSFCDKTTRDILVARDQTVWIASETQGLDRFDKVSGTYEHHRHDPADQNSISSNSTYSLLEDQEGYIWIGTADNGLNRFDRQTGNFKRYIVDPHAESSISSDCIISLYEDEDRTLWIGTRSGGLNKLDAERTHFSILDLNSEPSRLTVYGILQDDHDYLWLSTNQGLMKAHPDSGLVNTYTISDGVQPNFYFSSCAKGNTGLMYFGGMDGYNVFHPDSIKNNPHVPPIVLTGLMVNYENVAIGENGSGDILLDRSITFTKNLVFSYEHEVIRFKFAALNYSASYKNQYAYKLEGYDSKWIESGTENTAQYMNLPAGTYTFRVRGSNNDGVWNEEGLNLAITVLPPFWKTLWFRTFLSIFLIALIFIYIRLRTAKIRAEQVKLEGLVRERTEQWRKELEDRQRLEIEKTQMKTDHLKRELLTQSLHLNDKQQIMEELHDELEVVCEQKPDEARSRLKKLQRFLKDKIAVKQGWDEFETWFRAVHTGFYSTLREKYPELSDSELKVCALLRLKMSSKDIARVMNVQPPSVDIYRHRIRKKIDLSADENLSTFLGQI